jgi:cytochrome P450
VEPAVIAQLEMGRFAAVRALRRDPIGLLERAASLGDLTKVRMPGTEVYLVNHPDHVWEVLATGNRDFHKSPALQNARRVLGDGLLTSEDEHHRRQRRLIQPIFHHDRIDTYGDVMVEEARRSCERFSEGADLDVRAEMARLTLAVVGRTLFATDVGSDEASAVTAAIHEILSQFGRQFSPWFPITEKLPTPASRRFDRSVAVFDRLIGSLIAERRTQGGGDDLLSLLLAAQEDGVGMSDRQVRDEAVTLFLAGHETTSNALTWTWWWLSQHPAAEARLHAELDTVLEDRPPVTADLGRLPYANAVVSESLRLRPPAWAMGREVIAPHELAGVRLPVGSVVVVSPWLLHHDARWWSDPDAFLPERWLTTDPDRPRHAYLPFGGGPRMCIGEGFASMEAVLLLATIAQRWRFTVAPSARVEMQPVITLRPRYGLAMVASRRRSS